jgi:hypothetical protein
LIVLLQLLIIEVLGLRNLDLGSIRRKSQLWILNGAWLTLLIGSNANARRLKEVCVWN